MNFDGTILSPAIEAIEYKNIKNNYCLRRQDYLRLPKGEGNMIIMLSPSRQATFNIIESGFPLLYKSGYRLYATDTKIRTIIGRRQINVNDISGFKSEFRKAVSNPGIKFISMTAIPEVLSKRTPFIYDMGELNKLYFRNRIVRSADIMCEGYLTFLLQNLDKYDTSMYSKKIMYISLSEWNKIGCKFGIVKDMIDNPVSVLIRLLLKKPALLKEFVDRDIEFLFVNEDEHEFIKLEIPDNISEGSNNKTVYNKFRNNMSKMKISHSITSEDDIDGTDENLGEISSEANKLKEEMKKNLTGNSIRDSIKKGNINDARKALIKASGSRTTSFDDLMIKEENDAGDEDYSGDENTPIDNFDDDEARQEEIIEEENEEIKDVIDNFVDNDKSMKDPNMSEADKKAAIENEVKNKVYIAKFFPEKTAKQLKYIDTYTGIQNQILRQSVDEMKSKIIDETVLDDKIVHTSNEDLKTIKYANADKSYVEKKYMPDINNAVAILSKADVKVFIESIDEEDTSDQMNQKKTLTYHLVDENGKKHTVSFDIPIIMDGCYMYLGGSRKMIGHQRIFKPIVKIGPATVQIVAFYNKIQIERYGSSTDADTTAMKKFIMKNDYFTVKFGNAKAKNVKYKTSLEFDDYARSFTQISYVSKNNEKIDIVLDLPTVEEQYKEYIASQKIDTDKDFSKNLYHIKINNRFICPTGDESGITDFIKKSLPDNIAKELSSVKGGRRFAYARAKILNKFVPLVFFMLFCEGFTSVMKKCKIDYEIFQTKKEISDKYGSSNPEGKSVIQVADAFIVYSNYPYENSLLLNGLVDIAPLLMEYTLEELDSKDTYIDILTVYYASPNQAKNLDKYRMFMIDKKTEEILMDFNLPTDLIELLFYACKLLSTNQYLPDNDMHNMRIRSNEIVSQIVYQYVVEAYSRFLATQNRKRPDKITVPKDAVIKALLSSSLVDDASIVNPVYTLEKTRTCTIKASTSAKNITLTGINKTDGYGMDKRAFDPSMTGIFGLTSNADANVGIVRELSLEPSVTSTNGYLDVTDPEDVNSLNASNIFTAVELLTPPGVLHDDPQRSAMMRGQTSKMVMTDNSQPVLIGNKVESIVPYHLNNDFSFVAKEDGKVIDMSNGIYVVQYKSGKYESFDTNERVMKNSSDGSYTRIKFDSRVKVGDSFKKNEVLAVEPKAMTFNHDDRGASCNIGVLAKVAVMSLYDVFEDSEPITSSLSKKLGYWAIEKKTLTLDANTYVESLVHVGDHVDLGSPLCVFDSSRGDPEVQKYLDSLRKSMKDSGVIENLVQSNNTVAKSPTTGEIADIAIYSTVPIEQLSPTLQKIVKDYRKGIEKTEKFLDKYKNPGDNRYYKCGRLFTETTDTIETKYGKVKGEQVGDGVVIEIYIKHHDIVKKGDKMTNYVALKGVDSHVIPEGLEPWSENNPDEEVSCFITPISITARKTPSIFIPMFGNKVLIEAKRKMVAEYKKARGLK